MNVVIVESPAKAKTINKYLGPGFEVFASYGHVRDLPPKDGSVAPDDDFKMIWQVDGKAQKRLSEIAAAVKDADRLILATDPDREGEAISWHVLEVLKEKRALKGQKIDRVVFNAITKAAVQEAMAHPREIDHSLVDAYLARRALDYLVGFTLSPVLWRKLPGARSAGRVQSVALRLVCDREREIEAFKPQEYWSVAAQLATPRGDSFEARLVGADGKKIQRLDVGSEKEARDFEKALNAANFKVASIEAKPAKRNPYPPFTTSTLQQEASRKLGFAPSHTMRLAQRLYEGIELDGETTGLITYMRTDGIDLAPEAITQARDVIASDYGKNYLPNSPRIYKNKSKSAQEAHEAIRPTDLKRHPKELAKRLDADQMKLYELIWVRTLACQMESAELERTTVEIDANVANGPYKLVNLRATGTVVKFDGFLTLYNESRDDDFEDEDARRLPAMSQGEALRKSELKIDQHFTEPPPRFSEASLVKRMEELGIGRPSTYASILQVLRDRTYTRLDKKRIIPEDKGRIVIAFLESYFPRYVEYDFTADLEGKLDEIANHELDYKSVLREFWTGFTGAVAETKDLRIKEVIDVLDALLNEHNFPPKADGTDARQCPQCGNGRLGLKVGKFGAFIGCSNYPECRFTRALTAPGEGELSATKELGEDPETRKMVTVRSGRFGPYIQLGEAEDTGEKTKTGKPVLSKPKRASIPKSFDAHELDFDTAISLLSLPREVGKHPESGEPIVAGYGRFGPYVKHQDTYASLTDGDEVLTVGLNRAVTLIAEKIARGPGRGRRGKPAGRALGEHPALGGPVTQHEGKYGPYVSHDKVNATIPAANDPATITLEEAVALIEARAGKGSKKAAKPKKEKKEKKAKEANGSGEESAGKPKKKSAPRKKALKKKENGADEPAKTDE
jgi:DNA topoisomerase-1